MVDLDRLEMTDLGETDGFEFESLDNEGIEHEGAFDGEIGDGEGFGEFEEYEAPRFESGFAAYEDLEADPFIGNALRSATRALAGAAQGGLTPAFFRQVGQQAAKVAGCAVGGEQGAKVASRIASQVLREGDGEDWEDSTYESDPFEPEALDELEYNAYMAAESETEQEADPFLGNLVGPLLSGLLGESESEFEDLYEDGEGGFDPERDEFLPALLPFAPLIAKGVGAFAAPLIAKGVGAVGKMLNKQPQTRKLARCLPRIMKESLNEAQSLGRRPTQRDISAILGRQTARTLGSRQAVTRTFRQNRIAASRAQGRPSTWQRGGLGGGMSSPAMGRPRRPAPVYGMAPGMMPRRRRRGPVVGYMLQPIYANSRRSR